ncbi:MAG: ribosome small subunit-dependent GTPase A [Lachnospiraceae bacterium]|jgi:ribosome biogenesis GTPase|nr:ribosome small subunit-dependent GTPase A [Lachnospiraceae bacterium]
MQGKIVKGIAGFYYVHVVESGIYECKAKGIFRKEKMKPLVGDDVELEILNEEEKKGNIIRILPRRNELLRPAVSNVDQAIVIFAGKKPDPNYNLLDRFLIRMQMEHTKTIICINKADLLTEEERESIRAIYAGCGSQLLFTSTKTMEGLEALQKVLLGKTSTVAGPSGVGKSSLINLLQGNTVMETGSISTKIERGKHTTRHSQLIPISGSSYIMDTPGFSTLYINELEKEELKDFYDEFSKLERGCRFPGCNHVSEPDCQVKLAVEDGKIAKRRYENYTLLFEELKNVKRY